MKTLAAIVIVVAGLQASTAIVVPVLVAAFLSLICLHPVRRLREWGVPNGLAIAVVLSVLVLVLFLLTAVVGTSVGDFSANIGQYEDRFDQIIEDGEGVLRKLGFQVGEAKRWQDRFDVEPLLRLVLNTAGSALSTISNFVVIAFIIVFMLLEAQGMPAKLRRAAGGKDADISQFGVAVQSVYQYLSVKTAISFGTGVIVTIALLIVGIDYPVLWGLVAFLFNFIPNVGSIMAAVPVMLLALVQKGWSGFFVVGVIYLAVNMAVGNVIEPRVMGKRMGISPLVVILSLLFWNWVLGPIGMLLSVPLTTVLKIWLEHTEDGRYVAVLLGPSEDPDPQPGPRPEAAT